MIMSPNKKWCNLFFLFGHRYCDRELIVVIEYYFQIWIKKTLNVTSSRVMSSHIGPMYIETPYSCAWNIFILDASANNKKKIMEQHKNI